MKNFSLPRTGGNVLYHGLVGGGLPVEGCRSPFRAAKFPGRAEQALAGKGGDSIPYGAGPWGEWRRSPIFPEQVLGKMAQVCFYGGVLRRKCAVHALRWRKSPMKNRTCARCPGSSAGKQRDLRRKNRRPAPHAEGSCAKETRIHYQMVEGTTPFLAGPALPTIQAWTF